MRRRAWSHNSHVTPALLRLLPDSPAAALDVGCGDGSFAAALAGRCGRVVALDVDAGEVARARRTCADLPTVTVVQGDFLAADLPAAGFDVVTAVASWHHLPFADAAARARELLRPGGRLLVLGVWTDRSSPAGRVFDAASFVLNRVLWLVRGRDVMTSPTAPPTTTLAQARAAAAEHLPGARVRRRLLWRYTLVWNAPR